MPTPAEEALLEHLRTIRPRWAAFVEGLTRRDRLQGYLRIDALPAWQRREITQRLAALDEALTALDHELTRLEAKTPELDQRVLEAGGGRRPRRRPTLSPDAPQLPLLDHPEP